MIPRTDWRHLAWFALAAILLVFGIGITVVGAIQLYPGLDYSIYMDRAHGWLDGEGFYLARQIHGSYVIENGDALYPPTSLLLFVPFAFLPAVLWWAIPIGVTATIVIRYRPSLPAWALIGFAMIAGVGFANTYIKGNPLMWVAMFVALATVKPAFGPLVLLKPTALPFAFLGVRDRTWWLTLASCALVSLAFLPMWSDWIRTIVDGTGRGWMYSVSEMPTLLIPLIAWAGRTK